MTKETPVSLADVPKFRKLISSLKQSETAKELETRFKRNPYSFFNKFFREDLGTAPTFFLLVDDPALESELAGCLDATEFEALSFVLEAWRIWTRAEPERAAGLRSTNDTNPYFRLSDVFKYQLNDIMEAYGNISASTSALGLRYNGIFRLINAQKNVGTENEFFVSTSLESFILSIAVLIDSLRLTGDDRPLIRSAMTEADKKSISKAFERIEKTLGRVRGHYFSDNPTDDESTEDSTPE